MGKLKYLILITAAVLLLAGIFAQVADKPLFSSPAFAEDEDKGKEADAKEEGKTEATPCPECPECPDPAKVVLRGLEEKKQAIESARNLLDQERKELETYEAQIDESLASLTALKKQIDEDMARMEEKKTQQELEKEAAFEAKMGRLVKMYAGMKPKAAALIVDKMELEVAQEIFLRMREASASQILSFVDSAKAAKISERLAFKQQ